MSAGDPLAAAQRGLTLHDGTPVVLRPIRPDDEPLIAAFHAGLSPRSVYQRYFHIATLEQRTTQQRLALTCHDDPAHGAALVAEHLPARGDPEILALGRIRRAGTDGDAEIAIIVADRAQGQGLGTAMTAALVDVARRLGVRRLYGDMFADNDAMRVVVRQLGFAVHATPGDARVLRAELALD
ncbi:MAG: N-acetyltransferase family protein [Vicinamibacterales bacterium]